ncbi:hypothetical protein Q8A73_006135 [Channa argus]|nr:hypothetical protein Q8A73_006135 [Channa argus]
MSEYHRQNDTVKFFCKENDFFICEDILPTKSFPKSNRRFTVTDTNSGFIISISDVSSEEAGVYWCGVKSDQGKYRSAFRQIQLQVLTPPTTSTPSIRTSVASDQTTTGPAETHGERPTVIGLMLCSLIPTMYLTSLAAVTATVVRVAALVVAQKSEEIEEKNRKVGIVAMQRYRTHPEDRLRNCNENSCDGTQERL